MFREKQKLLNVDDLSNELKKIIVNPLPSNQSNEYQLMFWKISRALNKATEDSQRKVTSQDQIAELKKIGINNFSTDQALSMFKKYYKVYQSEAEIIYKPLKPNHNIWQIINHLPVGLSRINTQKRKISEKQIELTQHTLEADRNMAGTNQYYDVFQQTDQNSTNKKLRNELTEKNNDKLINRNEGSSKSNLFHNTSDYLMEENSDDRNLSSPQVSSTAYQVSQNIFQMNKDNSNADTLDLKNSAHNSSVILPRGGEERRDAQSLPFFEEFACLKESEESKAKFIGEKAATEEGPGKLMHMR